MNSETRKTTVKSVPMNLCFFLRTLARKYADILIFCLLSYEII